jgi:hypothetical protein
MDVASPPETPAPTFTHALKPKLQPYPKEEGLHLPYFYFSNVRNVLQSSRFDELGALLFTYFQPCALYINLSLNRPCVNTSVNPPYHPVTPYISPIASATTTEIQK